MTDMSSYRAIGLAEGFETGTDEEIQAAWQHLVDTGMAWTLPGWFGRTAMYLIEQGVITRAEHTTEPPTPQERRT